MDAVRPKIVAYEIQKYAVCKIWKYKYWKKETKDKICSHPGKLSALDKFEDKVIFECEFAVLGLCTKSRTLKAAQFGMT